MATLAKMCFTSICIGILLTVVCDCRYLPTRSHGDDLDKLRELMLQILESSNEEAQQQRPPNEANGNTLLQRSSWLNKLSPIDAAAAAAAAAAEGQQRKYAALGVSGPRSAYEGARYY